MNAGPPPPNHHSTYFEKPFGSFQIAVFGYPIENYFFRSFPTFVLENFDG
jgi:hypothetical protein